MIQRTRASLSAIALCVLLAALTAVGAHARDGNASELARLRGTMRTKHFMVHYDPKDPFLAKLMAETAEEELTRISRELGYNPNTGSRFPLYVFPTHIGFIEAGGLETSKYTIGTTTSGIDLISVDASGVFAPPEQILAHEITHAVVFRRLGRNAVALPLWMNEGLAKYYSDELRGEDEELIAAAAADGAIIPLERLRFAFPEKGSALAYAQSSSAARYLVKHYGRNAPKTVLAELAKTGSFDKAMIKATRRTGDRFANEWYSDVSRSYWPVTVARIWAAVVSALMAVLAVAAFLARRRKMAQAAREWEEEELERRMQDYVGPEE